MLVDDESKWTLLEESFSFVIILFIFLVFTNLIFLP